MNGKSTSERGSRRTAATSFSASVYSSKNWTCIGCIGSCEGKSLDGVTSEGATWVRRVVLCTLLAPVAGVAAPGDPPTAGDEVAGANGNLGVVPKTTGGFVPKRGPAVSLESVTGASEPGSGFGKRLNVPSLIPANGLGTAVVMGCFVASSVVDFVMGFGKAPSEKLFKSSVGAGVTTCAVAAEAEAVLSRGTPFVVSSGGVFGLAAADEDGALKGWSAKGSSLTGGSVVTMISAGGGEGGALEAPSHCPNGVFGDAGRGLSEGFSPLTSSSSPPDTGVFARGELRSGRVLGLPRLPAETWGRRKRWGCGRRLLKWSLQ
ncbi:hypothetical protein F5148DRAFT_560375 [Russula earlei]|uniref:Uncharacterized protein n=1 Tax=Russula earlei TaxID=71964 RepID=A0ACC0UMR7_9AGAM|nr:hypothetical protein F5148DRAFT_560375 [Russula earlei]